MKSICNAIPLRPVEVKIPDHGDADPWHPKALHQPIQIQSRKASLLP